MIEFDNVSKTYGRTGRTRPALSRVTFKVEEGEFALLMGPSGAGKSTLLKLILAMERPDRGKITVAGRNVHRLTKGSIPYLRRNLGAVFQDFKLLMEATPAENVALALQVLGMRPREVTRRAREALDQVGLDPMARKPVRQLSGGEQQRVALARALAGRPAVLLADEPTGNLDPSLTRDILERLDEIRAAGTTILLATHDPIVRDHVGATRLLYLHTGHLIDDAVNQRDAEAPEAPVEAPSSVSLTLVDDPGESTEAEVLASLDGDDVPGADAAAEAASTELEDTSEVAEVAADESTADGDVDALETGEEHSEVTEISGITEIDEIDEVDEVDEVELDIDDELLEADDDADDEFEAMEHDVLGASDADEDEDEEVLEADDEFEVDAELDGSDGVEADDDLEEVA